MALRAPREGELGGAPLVPRQEEERPDKARFSPRPAAARKPRAAAAALQQRILAQRDWLAGVAEDRKVARAMIARGPIAHEAWLAAKYAANPFNGARPPELGDSSPLFDYGR